MPLTVAVEAQLVPVLSAPEMHKKNPRYLGSSHEWELKCPHHLKSQKFVLRLSEIMIMHCIQKTILMQSNIRLLA